MAHAKIFFSQKTFLKKQALYLFSRQYLAACFGNFEKAASFKISSWIF